MTKLFLSLPHYWAHKTRAGPSAMVSLFKVGLDEGRDRYGFQEASPQSLYLSLVTSDLHKRLRGTKLVKNLPANAGDARDSGLVPGPEESPGGGNGNPLQYSCLRNPMDRGAWWATAHGVTKSQT